MANWWVHETGDDSGGATKSVGHNTLAAALTAASAGDTVWVSDGVNDSSGSNRTVGKTALSGGVPVTIISVDGTGPDTPTAKTKGAKLTQTAAVLTLSGNLVFDGMEISMLTVGSMSSGGESRIHMRDGILRGGGAFLAPLGESRFIFEDGDIDFDTDTAGWAIYALNAHIRIRNSRILSTGNVLQRVFNFDANGAQFVEFDSVEVQGSATTFNLCTTSGSTHKQSSYRLIGSNVQIPANGAITSNAPKDLGEIEIYGLGIGSAATPENIYIANAFGDVVSDTTTYLDAQHFTTNHSHLASTNATGVPGQAGVWWMLCDKALDSVPASITVELTSDSTINDDDFWIEVDYPTTTGALDRALVSSRAYFGAAELTDSISPGWTIPKTNEYKITLSSFPSAAAGVWKIYATAAGTSQDIFVNPNAL